VRTLGRDGFEGVPHLYREWELCPHYQTLCWSKRDDLVRSFQAMPEKLRDQPNARADSQRRRCYPFQRTQVGNPIAFIIKVQRVGANLVAWASDLDVRGNVYHDGVIKEVDRLLTMAVVGVRAVVERIRQSLRKCGLTRTKNP
jgi:hypothetical protein